MFRVSNNTFSFSFSTHRLVEHGIGQRPRPAKKVALFRVHGAPSVDISTEDTHPGEWARSKSALHGGERRARHVGDMGRRHRARRRLCYRRASGDRGDVRRHPGRREPRQLRLRNAARMQACRRHECNPADFLVSGV